MNESIVQRVGVAWRELRRVASARGLRSRLYGAGPDALDPGQFDVLDQIVAKPGWRMGELAEALHVEASTATRAVDKLVARELVERHQSASDGRGVTVHASEAGRELHAAIAHRRSELVATFLNGWDEEDQVRLADLLERLTEAMESAATPLESNDEEPRELQS